MALEAPLEVIGADIVTAYFGTGCHKELYDATRCHKELDESHQSADWVSVHEKICQLLIPLRTAMPFYTSEEERRHGREQTIRREKFLAELTQSIAQKFLSEGKHEDAVPSALHSLKFNISVYGTSSVELVPAFIILAEASLGLGHLVQAEEYLSQAQWIVLKKSHSNNAIQSRLHRNLGLLFAAKGNYEDSLYHLANDIYFACCAFGTNHIAASGGYFHMANVFYRQNRMDVADSLYAEVTDIWHKYFSHLIDIQFQELMTPAEVDMLAEEVEPTEETLDVSLVVLNGAYYQESVCKIAALQPNPNQLSTTGVVAMHLLVEGQRAEATQMLNAILELREQGARPQPAKIIKVLHALAMLHYLSQNVSKAHELIQATLEMSKLLTKYETFPEESLQCLIKLIKSKERPFFSK